MDAMHKPTPPKERTDRGLLLVGPGEHFGRQLLLRFGREGFKLGAIGRSRESLSSLTTALSSEGTELVSAAADITEKGFANTVRALSTQLAPISCLIYNPKSSVRGSGLRTDPSELSSTLAVNVVGALVAIQEALPSMPSDGTGCIILSGGGFKDKPDSERFALSVGKAGLHGVARGLVEPLARRGVRLKTVVIRGYVRDTGPIRPDELADFYWRTFCSHSRSVYTISPDRPDDQLRMEL